MNKIMKSMLTLNSREGAGEIDLKSGSYNKNTERNKLMEKLQDASVQAKGLKNSPMHEDSTLLFTSPAIYSLIPCIEQFLANRKFKSVMHTNGVIRSLKRKRESADEEFSQILQNMEEASKKKLNFPIEVSKIFSFMTEQRSNID